MHNYEKKMIFHKKTKKYIYRRRPFALIALNGSLLIEINIFSLIETNIIPLIMINIISLIMTNIDSQEKRIIHHDL